MPFFLIPTALAVCFCLMWVFIGGMIFRDSQLAAQRDRDSDIAILPLVMHRPMGGPKMKQSGNKVARVAS